MACVLVGIIGDNILFHTADSFLERNGLCVLTICVAQALENHTLLLNQVLSFCWKQDHVTVLEIIYLLFTIPFIQIFHVL
jgi:hypothetical protein